MSAEPAAPTPSVPSDPPLTRAEFKALADELVALTAPRLFAVIQTYEPEGTGPEDADAWVAAWGMAFEEHAEIVSASGGIRMSVRSLDRAVGRFGRGEDTTARVVWVPGAA
ncbi:hypothetical protein AB0P17_05470 [Streptomyces sp. NPDC088124]|uniref:hypothetical protein n=1 Tax=Streptomyces sp. NPDC088124 TaxID=3154654 RepID=UPI003432B553